MLTHSDDKNFMCSECGYVTKWKHYLNVHMRKHTGDLRYCPRAARPGSSVRAPQILLRELRWVPASPLPGSGCCLLCVARGKCGLSSWVLCRQNSGVSAPPPRCCSSELGLAHSADVRGPRAAWVRAGLCQKCGFTPALPPRCALAQLLAGVPRDSCPRAGDVEHQRCHGEELLVVRTARITVPRSS